MIELLAAVTALAFQICLDLAILVFWELPVWLWGIVAWHWQGWREDDGETGPEGAWDEGRVRFADCVGAMVESGMEQGAAELAAFEVMKKRNAIDGLVGLGVSKTDASAMVRLAAKQRKG